MTRRQRSVAAAGALAILAAASAWSQSNEVIDALLAEEQATLGKAADLVLTAAGIVEETRSVDEAFAALQERPWGFAGAAAADRVSLGSFASLVMRAFDMRGGLMYRLTHARRYAAREFAYRDFIQGDTAPGRTLSGRDVTHALGRVLESLGQRSMEVAQ